MIRILFFLLIASSLNGQSEDKDAIFVRSVYDHILTEGSCYDWLHSLTKDIGPRFSGTDGATQAVAFTDSIFQSLEADQVIKQAVLVPKWQRGEPEIASIVKQDGQSISLNTIALGGSVSTGPDGITGKVIEVHSLDTLEVLGPEKIKDKIVFFNRPMDPKYIRTFYAYGSAVDQRVFGASRAAKQGAKAALVRSMTTLHDDAPHTGTMYYEPDVPKKIPSFAISTNDANRLSKLLKEKEQTVYMKNNSVMLDSVISYNVVAEITGSEFPDEIILIGGHLDSWDVGEGAHDDGSGCMQTIQVMETLKALNYQPKRTLRFVMFMNEEFGLSGGREYARLSNENNEFHLAAIESDAGGFTPRGFSCEATDSVFTKLYRGINQFLPVLETYDLYLKKGGSGADIGPLKSQNGLLIGLRPDSQRYFDYHHTKNDVFEAVNERELKLGAAAMTSLVYLIDQHGLHGE